MGHGLTGREWHGFVKHVVDRAVRDWGRDSQDRRREPPEGAAGAWRPAPWSDDGRIDAPAAQRRELVRLYGDWQAWIGQLRGEAKAAFRLCFRLEPPVVDAETGQARTPDRTARYLARALV